MTDDTDFSGGRLRLAAFLRAVENGMPQRPSRFKRKPQLPKSALESSDMNGLEALCTAGISHPINDSAVEGRVTGARTDGPSHTEDASQRIPGSPDFEETASPNAIGHEKQTTMGSAMPVDTGSQVDVTTSAHRSATKRPSKETRKSSRSRDHPKRQPPVNCLSLLRTTTSDGLPDPLDARTTFAVPISEVDPIHDTQQKSALPAPEHLSVAQLHNVRAESKVLKINRKSKQPDSFQVKKRTGPCPRPEEAPLEIRSTQNQVLSLHDGFVGGELTIIRSRRTYRCAENKRLQSKPRLKQPGLQLATGELPTPLLKSDDQQIAAKFQSTSMATLPAGPRNMEVHQQHSTSLQLQLAQSHLLRILEE